MRTSSLPQSICRLKVSYFAPRGNGRWATGGGQCRQTDSSNWLSCHQNCWTLFSRCNCFRNRTWHDRRGIDICASKWNCTTCSYPIQVSTPGSLLISETRNLSMRDLNSYLNRKHRTINGYAWYFTHHYSWRFSRTIGWPRNALHWRLYWDHFLILSLTDFSRGILKINWLVRRKMPRNGTSTPGPSWFRSICTEKCQDKVVCYLFVLCLMIDDFTVDINQMASDLQLKPAK